MHNLGLATAPAAEIHARHTIPVAGAHSRFTFSYFESIDTHLSF